MKFSTMMAVALASVGAVADTLYVNNVTGNDGNVGTADFPLKTIQAAISAAHPGDVVSVAPGVYGEEQGSTPKATAGQTCRVWINKSITLMSSVKGGAVIVGKLADADGKGGIAAIRVSSDVATSAANPVEISGFVIRDCSNDGDTMGGVVGWSGTSDVKPSLGENRGPWVVDCVVSNCTLNGCSGVLGRLNAARVLLRNNTATSAGVNLRNCNAVHSIFVGAAGQVGVWCDAGVVLVNCTVVGGSHNAFSSGNKANLYNVLVTGGANSGTWCTEAHNSVLLGANEGDFTDANSIGSAYIKGQVAAPLYGDYRPLVQVAGLAPDAAACGRGDAKWLEVVPEKYRFVDFEGTSFSADGGSVQAGAVQTPVTPVCGFCHNSTDTNLRFDGHFIKASSQAAPQYVYLGEEDWPKAFELSAVLGEGEHLFGFTSDDSEVIRFPNRDGKALYVPQRGQMTSLELKKASKVLYVDDEKGSDTDCDGTLAEPDGAGRGPYKTINKATASVLQDVYTVVYVAPGTYDEGEYEWGSGVTPKVRVIVPSKRRLRVVATSTTEPTVIMGAADTTSETRDAIGNGPNAVRCIRVQGDATCCFQGFTITDGHTDSSSVSTTSYKGGGAFMCESGKKCWLMDCIVTNNFSANGGSAMYGGKAARCLFRGNRSPGETSSSFFNYAQGNIFCYLTGCVLVEDADAASVVMASSDTTLANCTLYSPVPSGKMLADGSHGYLFNDLVVHNDIIGKNAASKCMAGVVLDDTRYGSGNAMNKDALAQTNGPAYFVNPSAGDFHVATASTALGAGLAWGGLGDTTRWAEMAAYSNYYALVQHDFDGNGLHFVNGKPTAGAYQRPTKQVMIVSANRDGKVESTAFGTNMVAFGETVTVSATAKDGRTITGLDVNGEYVAGSSYAFTAGGPEDHQVADIRFLVNTNWYVDAENGDDARNHGWSETDAFKTLAGAMDGAEPGDTVIALPGVYREKTMLQEEKFSGDEDPVLPSRVIVKNGVSLVSRDGAEKTAIEGVIPATSTKFGDGAVRCVYMQPDSTLRGFTVRGGSTLYYDGTSRNGDNYGAGGVFCAAEPENTVEPTIWVTDCVISNNYGRNHAGGAYNGGGFVRCRFLYNHSQAGNGACSMLSRAYECVFDWNYGSAACNRPYRARGCTFGANNRNWSGTAAQAALASDPSSSATLWPICNCLFLGGPNCAVRCAYNCIVPSDGFLTSAQKTQAWEDVTVASVAVDANYTPDYDSAAANAANMDYVLPVELEGDVYGNPRRSNGGMDIGVVETDWRGRYAWNLGKRRLAVTEADWNVVENPDRSVLLPDGASLVCQWNLTRTGPVAPTVTFTVAEGATLTVNREGFDPIAFGPGPGQLALNDAQDLEKLTFLATGGSVDLSAFASNIGMMLIVR